VAQVEELLPSKCEALSSVLPTKQKKHQNIKKKEVKLVWAINIFFKILLGLAE
jgi:hypothetical protein